MPKQKFVSPRTAYYSGSKEITPPLPPREPCKASGRDCKGHRTEHTVVPPEDYEPFFIACASKSGDKVLSTGRVHRCRLWKHTDAHECGCGHRWANS